MKKNVIYSIVICVLNFIGIQAQQTVLSSGGNASGSGGTSSYSVGQLVFKTISGNGTVHQGIQMPYEISQVLGINDLNGINLNLLAYPNPTTNFLNLSVENLDSKNLSYQIFDLTGKQLATKKITTTKTTIEMAQYPVSVYFLKVLNQQKVIKTFKIIKN